MTRKTNKMCYFSQEFIAEFEKKEEILKKNYKISGFSALLEQKTSDFLKTIADESKEKAKQIAQLQEELRSKTKELDNLLQKKPEKTALFC